MFFFFFFFFFFYFFVYFFLYVFFFFFFQAEDGIRDATVTGVQTCALPISRRPVKRPPRPPTVPGARYAPLSIECADGGVSVRWLGGQAGAAAAVAAVPVRG